MKNMKKIVAVLVVMVMVLASVFALAACDKHECQSKCPECQKCTNKDCKEEACKDKCEGHGGSNAEVPVTAGKVTLYLTAVFAEALPTYATIYYAGGATGWATTGNALTHLEGTDIWYIQLALDSTVGQYNEYKVGLGYNATAGVGEDKQGMDAYAYVSAEAPSGLDNNKFEWDGTSQKVDLGTHHFNTQIPAPEKIKNVQLCVTFTESLGEHADVVIGGAFNGWNWDTHATPVAGTDRKTWSITLSEIIIADYQYLILVCPDTTMISEETKEDGVWGAMFDSEKIAGMIPDYQAEDEGAEGGEEDALPQVHAYIKIYNVLNTSAGGNLIYSASRRDNGNRVDLFMDKGEVEPLDLLGDMVPVEDTNWDAEKEENVPAGTYTLMLDTSKPVDITFTVEFETALAAGYHVWLAGQMTDWQDNAAEFTSTDRIHWSVTIPMSATELGKEKQFKVTITSSETFAWANEQVGDGETEGGNAVVKLPAVAGEVALFGEYKITFVGSLVEATFTVKFAGALTGKDVYLAGQMNGWTPAKFSTTDNINWTITIYIEGSTLGQSQEFLVLIVDAGADASYDTKIGEGGAYGGGNASVTLPAELSGPIALFTADLTLPA